MKRYFTAITVAALFLITASTAYANTITKRQYDAEGRVTRISFYDDNNNPKEDGNGVAVVTCKYDETGTLTDMVSYNLKGAEVPSYAQYDSLMSKKKKEQRETNGRIEKTSFYERINGRPIQVNGIAEIVKRYDKQEKLIETKAYDINGAEVDLEKKYSNNNELVSQPSNVPKKDAAFTVFDIPLNASAGDMYSVLEKKDINVKNEPFMDVPMKGSVQMLRIHGLPEEMISQGIIDGNIILGADNQEEPRLFFINLKFTDQKDINIIDTLNKKYGSPKLYYSSEGWSDSKMNAYKPRLIEHLKSISASAEAVGTNNTLYPEIINNLIVEDQTLYSSIVQNFKLSKESDAWNGLVWETFVFEWEKGDVKTFLSFAAYYHYLNKFNTGGPVKFLSGDSTNLKPIAITYVYMPLAKKVSDEIGRAIAQIKREKAEMHSKGVEGF